MALVKILGEKAERDNVLNISLVQICIRRGNSPFMLVYVEGIASVGRYGRILHRPDGISFSRTWKRRSPVIGK